MPNALQSLVGKWFGRPPTTAGTQPPDSNPLPEEWLHTANSSATPPDPQDDHPAAGFAVPFDDSLLERARALWCQGDWDNLMRMDLDHLEHHPDRAKLSVVVATAWLQQGDDATARRYLRHALDWGCDKKLVAQLLVAGVHNTLGLAAAITGDALRLERHFRDAVAGGSTPSDRASLSRRHAELQRLGIDPQPSFSHLTERSQAAVPSGQTPSPPKDTAFYRAFEDRFRGSRELIKQRVAVYLPFVQPIAARHRGLTVLDLGCGRGEWLEVLKEAGIDSEGVDVDAGMLEGCEQLGLRVRQGDALEYLQQQADASRICISLMHVVEHIPFEMLLRVVQEARRVLVDDGILIMETPNPENYTVGSCTFYIDPTHTRPIPPALMNFITEYYGFQRIKILRLQESTEIREKRFFDAIDYLNGVSPDYAIVAQTNNPSITFNDEEAAWSREYGVSISLMKNRNSQQL